MTRFNQTFSGRLAIHLFRLAILAACSTMVMPPLAAQAGGIERSDDAPALRQMIDGVVKPFLARHQAPGAIVAVSLKGATPFFAYGNATDDVAPFTPTTWWRSARARKSTTTLLPWARLIVVRSRLTNRPRQYMPDGYTCSPRRDKSRRATRRFYLRHARRPSRPSRQLENERIDTYTTRDFLRGASGWKPMAAPPAPFFTPMPASDS